MRLCLILEDEPTSARLARAAIDDVDAFSIAVRTLAEASRALEDWPVDLAIVDLGLPDGDGLDFVRELRSICACPILVCTGSADRETVTAAVSAGANDYTLKPLDVPALAARLRTWLGRSPPRWERWEKVAARTAMSRPDYERAVEAYAADLRTLAVRHGGGELPDDGALDEIVARATELGHQSLPRCLDGERANPTTCGIGARLQRAARSAELLLRSERQGTGPLSWRPEGGVTTAIGD